MSLKSSRSSNDPKRYPTSTWGKADRTWAILAETVS